MGRTGSDIASSLLGKSYSDREVLIGSSVANREYPSWLGALRVADAGWKEIVVFDKDAAGAPHRLVLRVAPRYFELGTDEDPLFIPMWPVTAQKTAEAFNAILPSEKIVDIIWENADVQLPIGPPSGFKIPGKDMEEVPSWIAHNAIVQKQASSRSALMAGGKKDLVIGPGLDGSKVAIYSTPFPGQGHPLREYSTSVVPNPWKPGTTFHPPLHQPYSTIHDSKYSDYSHGLRLISRNANLDGAEVDLAGLFIDPILYALVSDQKGFYPAFPNKALSLKYGVEEYGVTSGAAVDPTEPTHSPSTLASILPIPASPKERSRMIVGGAVGLAASLITGLTVPWAAGVTLLGAVIGRKWGESK
jgi:hypothetical protein